MSMDKYFTPDISDIRVGYECETRQADKWKFYRVPYNDCLSDYIDMEGVRVPYLTKEQIEAEGWVHTGGQLQSESRQDFEIIKSPHGHLELSYTQYNNNLTINQRNHVRDNSGNYVLNSIFRGKCKDINTFRWICKLIGV